MTEIVDDASETLSLVSQAAEAFVRPDAQRVRRVRDGGQGHDAAAWSAMASQGWLAVLKPDTFGSASIGLRAAALIAQRLGYACHTEPYVATAVLTTTALLRCPAGQFRDQTVEAIGEGRLVALAWQSPNGAMDASPSVLGRAAPNGIKLGGEARFAVPAQAETFIIAARAESTDLLCVIDAKTHGLTVRNEARADGGASAWLAFNDVFVPAAQVIAQGPEAVSALHHAIESGVLCASAELLGLSERALELTQIYLGERKQFGQAIGAFQVLQHRVVDMWIQKELTRAALRSALLTFAPPGAAQPTLEACRAAASSVKARASEAAMFITGQAVQLHGAIGTTDEYELGVYVNRCLTLASWLGNASSHRRRFGALVKVRER